MPVNHGVTLSVRSDGVGGSTPRGEPLTPSSPTSRASRLGTGEGRRTAGSSFKLADALPAGMVRAHGHGHGRGHAHAHEEPCEGSVTAQFKAIQKEIQESVERAEVKLTEYDIKESERAEQLELELADMAGSETELTMTPEDVQEMVPAASKAVLYQIAEAHDESMKTLLKRYKDLEPSVLGDPVELGPPDTFMENFKDSQELVDDVLAHRKMVEQKVEAARQTNLKHQQEKHEQHLRELEEMGVDTENPVPAVSEPTTAGGTGTGADASKLKALDENRRVLQGRIKDLEAELSEEQQNYQIMEETKDELIEHLKVQLERSQAQMENILGATAHELADSSAAVEDTRLHIAYLTIQLRNARELADSRSLDVDKWVKRTDMEAVIKQLNTMKLQVAKLAERVKAEQHNADEAHAYAKKCLRAKEKADLAHANWEVKLRETLKTRDSDLQGLQKETRLLHFRAEKLVQEMEETKARLEAEKQQAVHEAKQAAEEQRNTFNLILQERDYMIQKLKSQRQDLSDQLAAMTLVHEEHVAQIKREREERLERQVHASMLTDPIKIGGRGGLGGTGEADFIEAGVQTSSVNSVLWKVLRRKFAIEAIGSLDRKMQKLVELDSSLHALEAAMRAKWAESEAMVKTVSLNIASVPRNLQRLQGVVSAFESFMAMEETAHEKRSRVKTSIAQSIVQVRSGLQSVLNPRVSEQIDAERRGPKKVDDDASPFDEVRKMLLDAKEEMTACGLDTEDQLVGLTSDLRNLLDGETLQQIVSIRAGLVHEQQISQRFDLTHHKKCLTMITAGDFADSFPSRAAGAAILSHPHHEESKALGAIILEWNRQKTEWVKERLKIMQESNAIRKELQNAKVEILKGGGSDHDHASRPDTAMEAPDEHRRHVREDAAAYEMALNRSSSEDLEIEVEALTRAIVKWLKQQKRDYAFVEPQVADGLVAPPLWSKCLHLVQAASLAFEHAQDVAGARPDTSSYTQSDSIPVTEGTGSRPVTAGTDTGTQWVSLDDEQEHEEADASRDQDTTEMPEAMAETENQRAHRAASMTKDDPAPAKRSSEKKTHQPNMQEQLPNMHEKHHHASHSDSKGPKTEKEHHHHTHHSKHRLSTAHSHASVGTEELDLSMDARMQMLRSNNAAVSKTLKTLKQMLLVSRTPAIQTPESKPRDAVRQHCAACPGCFARKMPSLTEAKAAPAEDGSVEAYEHTEVSTQNMAAADDLGLSPHDVADGGGQTDEDLGAVQHRADRNEVGDHSETLTNDNCVGGSNNAAETDESRVHEYDVAALEARFIAWKEDGGEGELPAETCVHGHTHTLQDILELHQRRISRRGVLTFVDITSSSYALTPDEAATRLQTAIRSKNAHRGTDFLGDVVVSQLRLRAELEDVAVSVAHHIDEIHQARQDMQSDLLQLVEEDNKLKEQHEELSGQVSELQERYEKLVDKQARQRKDYEALICKLDETEQELAAARYRPPTTQVEVQTDHVEPDIVLVEQPPSQATLSAIAESVRAELNDYIEKLKERIAYLERRDEMYMKMNDEVEETQKRLEKVAQGTVAMASDLVEARETAIRNEEFANALLEQHAASTESEMQMLQHHISVADAVLQHISAGVRGMTPDEALQKVEGGLVERRSSKRSEVPAYLLKELAENDASSSAIAQEIIDAYVPRGAPAGLIRNLSKVAGETAQPQKIQFEFQGEPCPTCQGKGIKPVPPPKPPTQMFEVKKPSSAGRTISSPRALKKARTLHHAARGGVPKLKSVGRSVLLEDDEGQDFATNAERLLKLVDQDFADVIATRDQLKDMFDIDANRTKLSPRKKGSGALRVRHAALLNPASATSDKPEDKYTFVSTEKMAQLPSLFPPVTSSLKTPRGNISTSMTPWTPRDPTPGDVGGRPARDQLR